MCQQAPCKSSRVRNRLGKKKKKSIRPVCTLFYLISNPRIVTMTVQHQGKLLFDYSFSAEYPRKRRVFNSESHQPCTLMTTVKIIAVSLACHCVSVGVLQSLSRKHKEEEIPAFLLYQTALGCGLLLKDKKRMSDVSLGANLYGCP